MKKIAYHQIMMVEDVQGMIGGNFFIPNICLSADLVNRRSSVDRRIKQR